LIVQANSKDSTLKILNLGLVDDIFSFEKEFILHSKKDTSLYHGPEFNTLDQNLQLNFYDFFDSLGINNNIAQLLEALVIEKNNSLINNWMENLKRI